MFQIKALQKLIQQHLDESKSKEQMFLTNLQQLEHQMEALQKKVDNMQNLLGELQTEQTMLKHKAVTKDSGSSTKNGHRTSLKSQERESQTDTNDGKKTCRCGGDITQKEEDILSELFFQRF